MSGANGGRVKLVKEPSKREIQNYFTKAIFEGETWEDVGKKRKITVIAKPKGSATNTIILAVESLERPGSNNKTIYKRFASKEDRKGNKIVLPMYVCTCVLI